MPNGYAYVDDIPQEPAKAQGYAYVDPLPSTSQSVNKPAVNAKPVSDGRAAAKSVYPNLEITDNVRPANSPLGRKNPRSDHVLTRAAVDARAIPGMTFEQYVQGYRDKGYTILAQRDEYKNPSAWATGPHWHVTLGQPEETPAPAEKASGYQYVDAPEQASNDTPRMQQVGKHSEQTPVQISNDPSSEQYGLEYDANDPNSKALGNQAERLQYRLAYVSPNNKTSDEEEVSNILKEYPDLLSSTDKKTAALRKNQLLYAVKYYRGAGPKQGTEFYVDPRDLPEPITVTADPVDLSNARRLQKMKEAGDKDTLTGIISGFLVDAPSDLISGAFEGAGNLGIGAKGLITRGTDAIGLTDGAHEVWRREAEDYRLANEGEFTNPDGYARPIGEFIGETAALGPLSRLKPVTALKPELGGLSRLGDAAVQGGTFGAISSGGDNIPENIALNAAMVGGLHTSLEVGGLHTSLEALAKAWASRGAVPRTFASNPRVIEVGDTPAPSGVRANKKTVGDEIAALTKDWTNSPDFVVHANKRSFAKAEPELWAKLKEDGAEKAPAFYADDGRIHVIADNVKDVSRVKSIVFHEALGHSGLANKFGEDLDNILSTLYEKNWRLRNEADALRKNTQYGEIYSADANPTARYVEEVLAKRSENGVISKGVLDKFIPMLRDYARKTGLDLRFTDREVRAILADAHNTVVNGGTTNAGGSGLRYILTTHVSPHEFTNTSPEHPHGRFDHSKMGTGEGAQMYGWGTYLGENTRDVYYSKFEDQLRNGQADVYIGDNHVWGYADNLFAGDPSVRSFDVSDAARNVEETLKMWRGEGLRPETLKMHEDLSRGNYEKARTQAADAKKNSTGMEEQYLARARVFDLEADIWKSIRENHDYLMIDFPEGPKPKTYEVDVPEEQQARMLQWDKTLDEQPDAVKAIAKKFGIKHLSEDDRLALRDKLAVAKDETQAYFEKHVNPIYEKAQEAADLAYTRKQWEITRDAQSLSEEEFLKKYPDFADPNVNTPAKIESVSENLAWAAEREAKDAYLKANPLPDDIRAEYGRLADKEDAIRKELSNATRITGEELYSQLSFRLGGDRKASEFFAANGVPGNKYADGFTRNKKGDKSYNYVMFNDKGPDAPKIINKYILPEDFGKATKQEIYESLRERFDPLPDNAYTYRGNGYKVELDAIDNPDGKGLRLDRMFKLTEGKGEMTGRLSYDWQSGNWVPTLITSKNGKPLNVSEGLDKYLRVEVQNILREALPEKDVEGFHEAAKKLLSSNKYILPEEKKKGYAGSINLDKIISKDGIDTAKLYTAFAEGIDKEKVTYEDAIAAVREAGITPSRLLKKRMKLDPTLGISAAVALEKGHADVIRLQKKILTGNATAREEGNFAYLLTRQAAIQEKVANYRSDIGRALNFMKIVINEKGPLTKDFFEKMHAADLSNREVLYRIAEMLEQNKDNPKARAKILKDQFTPFWEDYLISFRYSTMLYGLGTHTKNFVGNASMGLLDSATHLTAAGLGHLQGKSIRGTERVTFRGATLRNIAMMKALFEAQTWKDVSTAWKTGRPPHQISKVEVGHNLFTEKLGHAGTLVDAPQKALAASDSLWRSILENGQLYELAMRQANAEKLKGSSFWDRVDELIVEPTPEMRKLADDNTATLQLIDDPSVFGKNVERMKSRPKNRNDYAQRVLRFGLHIALPFTRVTDNILRAGIRHTPVLGMLDRQNLADFKAGGARRDLAIARQLVGATLIGYLVNKADIGELTGDGPDDYNLKAQMQAEGWKPNSIKLSDGKWHSLDGFDAVMPMANVIAQTVSHMKDKKISREDGASQILNLLAETGGNMAKNTFAKQAGDLFQLIGNGERVQSARENYFANLASSFVPANIRQYAEMKDGYVRDKSADGSIFGKIEAGIKASIPGLRETLPVKNDVYGNPILSDKTLSGVNKVGVPTADTVIKEISRLTVVNGKGALVSPATRRSLPEEIRDKATAEDVQAFQKLSGKYIYEDLRDFLGSEDYKDMTDEERIDEVKAIIRDARADAKDELYPDLEETPPPSPQEDQFQYIGG